MSNYVQRVVVVTAPDNQEYVGLWSPGFLAAVLSLVSGIARYGFSAWVSSAVGDACDWSTSGISVRVGSILLMVVPAIVVGYRAIAIRKSWLATIGLILAAASLTVIAGWIAAFVWAAGHYCFG
jgi:hypothetical protein